ncbi:MAG: M56 family metallopeptidase [Candidatus Delongbacteria bacterium]|nr:M56 family metallopeptidase [Candidatus Delongbacteria bacterium]MBN2836207.1 M56 family metallopeptidase [Candidatus Delongbacteria bacterium]
MNNMQAYISSFVINSIWIGLVISIIVKILNPSSVDLKKRYIFYLFSLFSIPFISLFFTVINTSVLTSFLDNSFGIFLEKDSPIIVKIVSALWFSGFLITISRYLTSFLLLKFRFERSLYEATDAIKNSLLLYKSKLKIFSEVSIYLSDKIISPVAYGFFKPMIILPIEIVTGQDPDFIKSYIVHELAHISRKDNIVNFLQIVLEIIMFYHPMVYTLNSKIRNIREMLTDELSVEILEKKDIYIKSIAHLVLNDKNHFMKLSASGGSVKSRIERLMNINDKPEKAKVSLVSLIILFLFVFPLFLNTASIFESPKSETIAQNLTSITDQESYNKVEFTPVKHNDEDQQRKKIVNMNYIYIENSGNRETIIMTRIFNSRVIREI